MMHGNRNASSEISSLITFGNGWPQAEWLIFSVLVSIFGCLTNWFFLAAFFIEDHLKINGLVFQAFVGFSDTIMTMAVIPTSTVLLLQQQGDSKSDVLCYTLQLLTETSTYNYSIYFALMSIEAYYRMSRNTEVYTLLTPKRVVIFVIFIFLVNFATAGVGVYGQLDYDCCYRFHTGNLIFRTLTDVVFHVIPTMITIFCSIITCFEMKHHADTHIYYRQSLTYKSDRKAHYLNIVAFVLYIGAWLPYFILVYGYPYASDTFFYRSVWLGVCRSVITSSLYGILDRNFRRAFARLFSYCFCKRAVSGRIERRHRMACEYHVASGQVRVHMMHHAINANSPRRNALIPRDAQY